MHGTAGRDDQRRQQRQQESKARETMADRVGRAMKHAFPCWQAIVTGPIDTRDRVVYAAGDDKYRPPSGAGRWRQDLAPSRCGERWPTLSVSAGPIPPFQMVAMTFTIGAAIGIVRARARGLPWTALVRWPGRVWLLGVGGLFGYHALYFAALQLAPPAEANLVNYLWPLLIVLLSAPLAGERLGWPHLVGALLGFAGVALLAVGRGVSFAGTYAAGLCAGAGLRLRLVALLGAVAPLRRDADRRDRLLLRRRRDPVARLPLAVRDRRCGLRRPWPGSPSWRSASARPAARSISGTMR